MQTPEITPAPIDPGQTVTGMEITPAGLVQGAPVSLFDATEAALACMATAFRAYPVNVPPRDWIGRAWEAESQADAAIREMKAAALISDMEAAGKSNHFSYKTALAWAQNLLPAKPAKVRRATAMRKVTERAQKAEALAESRIPPPPPDLRDEVAAVIEALQAIRFSACTLEAARGMAKIALDTLGGGK